ncbi:MAG: hypothetical protein SGILL_001278 [Bacillariaceae sp.]
MRLFTHDEQQGDIDLCKICYMQGKGFVDKQKDESIEVEADGKPISGLTCKEFKGLGPVPIDTFEVASTRALSLESEESDLQRAMQLSLERANGFEVLLSRLFDFLLPLLVKQDFSVPLLRLLLDLVESMEQASLILFVKEVSRGISGLLQTGKRRQENLSTAVAANLAEAIKGLNNLLTPLEEQQQTQKSGAKLCSVHGLPTVKRKCAAGPNKDRRFWVCGLERDKRCDYFEWADESKRSSETTGKSTKSPDQSAEVRTERIHLVKALLKSDCSFNEQLCEALEEEYLPSIDIGGSRSERKKKQHQLPSKFISSDAERDISDGVLCSQEKLSDVWGNTKSVQREQSGTSQLLEAACDLLKLLFDHKTEGIERWIQLLCRLDMHSSTSIQSLSKNTLRSLCGGDESLCRTISDTNLFNFHLRKLTHIFSGVIDAGVVATEKARMSGPNWNDGAVHLDTLNAASLAGTNLLVPEDALTESDLKKIGKVLDTLDKLMRDGGKTSYSSWRQFCGGTELPRLFGKGAPQDRYPTVLRLTRTPPVVTLLWFASSVPSGVHQAKALRLVEAALTTDGDLISSTPQKILTTTQYSLGRDDLLSLSLCFVHNGSNSEVRRAGRQVLLKLFPLLSQADMHSMYKHLVLFVLKDAGAHGRLCIEVLHLLQELSSYLGDTIKVFSNSIVAAFRRQQEAIKNDLHTHWIALDNKRLIDLSDCCFCTQHVSSRSKNQPEVKKSGETSGSPPSATRSVNPRQKWHRDQISPFVRQRLEMEKSSDEFNLFFKLKNRVAISEFHLAISDPRGRYAKVVQIYVAPRHVGDVAMLKSDDFSSKWQKTATLRLARGAARASVGLSAPVACSNIRLHFEEFYARPGEGSGAALCPRCASPVTNLAGVCSRCGEQVVPSQCRQCRRINYDMTDSFFCVDCAFCQHGKVSLEVSAGVSTNALAIIDDKDSARTRKMLGLARSLEDELRESLRAKAQSLATSVESPGDSIFGPDMQRAFLGLAPISADNDKKPNSPGPLDCLDTQGSVVQAIARPDTGHVGNSLLSSSSDRSERTRSLINLARQIRSESGSSRAINLDSLEEILGGEGEGTEAAPDRGRRSNPNNNDDPQDGSKKTDAEVIQMLTMLTKEAGRERHALQRRLEAWEALNTGVLVNRIPNAENASFSPSHCSHCSSTVAYHLLELWLCMFNASPFEVQVDESILKMLLFEDTPTQSKAVVECKKRAVISIATKSRTGAEMVLTAMRKRLSACEDKFCAQILGKILEASGFAHPTIAKDFTKLAMEVLSSRSAGNHL